MRDHPNAISDFYRLYHVDPFGLVWSLDLTVFWSLMERLGVEPWSLWRAVDELGDQMFFGYTPEAQRLDSVQDWLGNVWHAVAQGNAGKKKVRAPEKTERPAQKRRSRPKSLDEVGSFFSGA